MLLTETLLLLRNDEIVAENSTDEDAKFEYLDTSDMTEGEKQELEDRLLKETKDMKRNYARLVTSTNESLQMQEVNPKDLAISILALGIFQADENVLNDVGKNIRNATSIADIFLELMCYWSFFNYELLEHIIQVFGTPEDKLKLQKYLDDLKKFCQRRIFEVPAHVYGNERKEQDWVKFTVKLDDEVQKLKDLCQVKSKIAEIIGLRLSALYLCRIARGCVEVVFMVPQLVAQKVFPLTDGQQKLLLTNHVVSNLVYCFKASHSKREPRLFRQPSKTAIKRSWSIDSTVPVKEVPVLSQQRRKDEEELKKNKNRKEELLGQQQQVSTGDGVFVVL